MSHLFIWLILSNESKNHTFFLFGQDINYGLPVWGGLAEPALLCCVMFFRFRWSETLRVPGARKGGWTWGWRYAVHDTEEILLFPSGWSEAKLAPKPVDFVSDKYRQGARRGVLADRSDTRRPWCTESTEVRLCGRQLHHQPSGERGRDLKLMNLDLF